MKNGRSLKGHRRQLRSCGEVVAMHRPPSGGWDVSCVCGWFGGNWPRSSIAREEYRKHIDWTIDHTLFRCKRCGIEKPASEMRHDYRYICLACFSDLGNDWQRKHPVQSARHKRNSHLIKKFGITVAEAESMLVAQGGVCAICREPIQDIRGYSPHVDHDHSTGKIRGILCHQCNNGLGLFKDDPKCLRAAAEYLERTSGGRE